MDLIMPTISQGLLWSLLAIGVYLTFRVLDIADLTVEGSFPLGAATAAALLLAGWHPIPAILAACAAGMVSGIVTGLLCTKLKIPALLAGIDSQLADPKVYGNAGRVAELGREQAALRTKLETAEADLLALYD